MMRKVAPILKPIAVLTLFQQLWLLQPVSGQ